MKKHKTLIIGLLILAAAVYAWIRLRKKPSMDLLGGEAPEYKSVEMPQEAQDYLAEQAVLAVQAQANAGITTGARPGITGFRTLSDEIVSQKAMQKQLWYNEISNKLKVILTWRPDSPGAFPYNQLINILTEIAQKVYLHEDYVGLSKTFGQITMVLVWDYSKAKKYWLPRTYKFDLDNAIYHFVDHYQPGKIPEIRALWARMNHTPQIISYA